MKTLILTFALTGLSLFTQAQNSSPVPNSGADNTVPPTNAYTPQNVTPSTPSNSTTPGANGSYTVDTGQPSIGNPGASGSYNTTTPIIPPVTTYTPQTNSRSNQKEKGKK